MAIPRIASAPPYETKAKAAAGQQLAKAGVRLAMYLAKAME